MASPLESPLSSGLTGTQTGGTQSGLLSFFEESPLPGQFTDVQRQVPDMTRTADALKQLGGGLAGQGQGTLNMAAQGQLTAPQQAQLQQYSTGLTNQARQQFYNMGRTPDRDTAFIGQTADIDAKVNAMAQQEIQSSIALGLGQLSSGASFFGQSLGFDTAAIQALIQTGNAQLEQDRDYRRSLTDTFRAIGSLFGGAAGGNLISGLTGLFGGSGGFNPDLGGATPDGGGIIGVGPLA